MLGEPLSELAFAHGVTKWLEAEAEHREALDLAARYALWAVLSEAGRREHGGGILFKLPHKVDRANLVPLRETTKHAVTVFAGADERRRHRDGFELTDRGASFAQALDHANYCIWCHNQEKDSCSKGLRDRKTGAYENDVFGVKLLGCPLEERISEMNLARSRGYVIGALAIVTIDNPLCAATGHRICNDCMKACIFQKQEPVDVPQVESRTLKGCSGAAVGLRDLLFADPVESPQCRATDSEARYRPQRACRWAGTGRLYARPSPAQ